MTSLKLSTRLATSLRVVVLVIVASLVMTTQSYASYRALVYNPMSLSNTTATTYSGHPVQYFAGWTNRFAMDINSPDEYADAPIYLWGAGWSLAQVGTGSPGNNAPMGWTSYSNSNCTTSIGTEYAMGMFLNLPNGQTAGVAVAHLSNYHYGPGYGIAQGALIANESYLSSGGTIYAFVSGSCQASATAPHIHVESARTGTTFANGVGGTVGPAYNPYWYYDYP